MLVFDHTSIVKVERRNKLEWSYLNFQALVLIN